MSNNRHRHTEKTLKVLNALAYTDAWRPAGSNHLWTETYPFESGLTNMEIFEQNKFCRFESEKSFCTKDGMIKGAVPCLENMDKRGCSVDGIFELKYKGMSRHVFTEFKLGDHTRFDGNDVNDILTGNQSTIEDFMDCIGRIPTTLGYVSVHYNPHYKGMLYSLWNINMTKLLQLLASGDIPMPPTRRLMGTRYFDIPTLQWVTVDENTKQSVFFTKNSNRTKKSKGKVLKDDNGNKLVYKYLSVRIKPSSLIRWEWSGKYDSKGKKIYIDTKNSVHTKTANILKRHKAIIRTTVGVQTATKFVHNKNLKASLEQQMTYMFSDMWDSEE